MTPHPQYVRLQPPHAAPLDERSRLWGWMIALLALVTLLLVGLEAP